MSDKNSVDAKISDMVREDATYTVDAYHFVFEALDYAMLKLGKHRRRGSDRHLDVSELLDGTRAYAVSQYGPLARIVLESMGIFSTKDIGDVVFRLVDKGLLNKQDSDSMAEFERGFSFHEAFDEGALADISW